MQRVGVICLTNGGCTIVDPERVEALSSKGWRNDGGYARLNVTFGKKLLHRVVLGAQDGQRVDHINGDKLDNRLCNLRLATPSQNSANSIKRKGSSKYKGVTRRSWGAWRAQICVNLKKHSLGHFQSEIDAAKAYNTAALKHFGEFARLNETP